MCCSPWGWGRVSRGGAAHLSCVAARWQRRSRQRSGCGAKVARCGPALLRPAAVQAVPGLAHGLILAVVMLMLAVVLVLPWAACREVRRRRQQAAQRLPCHVGRLIGAGGAASQVDRDDGQAVAVAHLQWWWGEGRVTGGSKRKSSGMPGVHQCGDASLPNPAARSLQSGHLTRFGLEEADKTGHMHPVQPTDPAVHLPT